METFPHTSPAKPGSFLAGCAGAFLSGFAALLGAHVMGLTYGEYDLRFVLYLVGGWFVGLVLVAALSLMRGTRQKSAGSRRLRALALPPLVAFALSIIAYLIAGYANEAIVRRNAQARAEEMQRREVLLSQLRADPELALRDQWDTGPVELNRAFVASLADTSIPYTNEMLERICRADPHRWFRMSILDRSSLDAAFLAGQFPEAFAMAEQKKNSSLTRIISHPNTPLELVAEVARSEKVPEHMAVDAHRILEKRRKASLQAQLRADPEIVLRDRWDQGSLELQSLFSASLDDPTFPYTSEMLERICRDAPLQWSRIMRRPSLDAAFLSSQFPEALSRAEKGNGSRLATLISHPNTPLELVTEIAQSKKLSPHAVDAARSILKKRNQKN